MNSERPADRIGPARASVVIPAYNEATTIGRLLTALAPGVTSGDLEVVVVPNGCDDRTADIAHAFGVQVIELAEGGKAVALDTGDLAATRFPRFYVDADIILTADDISALCRSFGPTTYAVAPGRVFDTNGSSWLVRSYLRIWDQLPSITESLAGRGCYGVDERGRSRWQRFPPVIADDAFVSSLFAPDERANPADITSFVSAPRTVGALIQRKRRGHRGNRELRSHGIVVTAPGDWLTVIRRHPLRILDAPAYVVITLVTRLLARRDERRGEIRWTTDR